MIIGLLLGLGLALHWLPTWRREQQFFAVTVPVDFPGSDAGQRVLRDYRIALWLATALGLAAALTDMPAVMAWSQFLQIGGAVGAFAWARRQLLPYATQDSVRTASLFSEAEHMPGGWAVASIPFAILAGAALYTWLHWDQIPARFPIHWDLQGKPNGWSERTLLGVFQPSLMGVVVLGVMLASGLGILHASRKPAGVDASWTRRFRQANLRMVVALMHGIAILFAGITVMPLFRSGNQLPTVIWVCVGLLVVVVIVSITPLIRMSSEAGSGSDRTPDDRWFWGQIYYNPQDPALMVEKRFGLGYTLNFGNRLSWLLTAAILVIPIAAILMKQN